MANSAFQLKRTSVSGRAANSTTLTRPGELALNMADGILYSTNGTVIFEIGANNTNQNVSGNSVLRAIIANSSIGTAGQVLASNGTGIYWTTAGGGTGTVTSVATGNGLTGGPITTTGTVSVLSNTGIVANTTGLFVNAAYIGTVSANNTTFVNGKTEGALNVNSATTATTATNATQLGGVAAASYVQNTDSRTLSGNLVFSAANVAFTGNIRFAGGVISNGTLGTVRQLLASNGTTSYWATPDMSFLPDAALKKSVRAATTTALTIASSTTTTLTGTLVALPAQDGITLAVGDRLLVKDQVTTSQNGIYDVTNLGSAGVTAWVLTRSADADTISEIASAMVAVDSGTVHGGKLYDNDLKTTDTLGTTGIVWNQNIDSGGGTFVGNIQFGSTAGAYPTSNSAGTGLGSDTQRWVLTANSGDFSNYVNVASAVIANSSGIYPLSNTVGFNLGSSTQRWTINALSGAFASFVTMASAVTMSTTTGNINVGTSQTTGTINFGGPTQTGAIALGVSTATQTMSIANGATTTGNIKTVNFATDGAAGSTTNVNIGSSLSNSFFTVNANTFNIRNNSGVSFSVGNSTVNFFVANSTLVSVPSTEVAIRTNNWSGLYPPALTVYGAPVSGGTAYNTLMIAGENTANSSNKGGVITNARYNNTLSPFSVVGSYDAGTYRHVYIGGGNWNVPDSTSIRFFTGPYSETVNSGVERMRLDGDGRLLINETGTARSNFLNASLASAIFQIEGTGATSSTFSIVRDSTNANPPRFLFGKSRGTTVGSNALVQNGDGLGSITFQGNDGSEFVEGALISSSVDGTAGTDSMPGRLEFHTSNSIVLAEKMRITSSGFVGIGNTSPSHRLSVAGDVSLTGGIHANGSFGTAGQVLTSNGTVSYWSTVTGGGGGGVYLKGGTSTIGSLATEGQNIFRVNADTLNNDTTIVSGENAQATGPLTVAVGKTLTIQSGGRVSIV